jgi:hypothetical protein
MVRTREDNPEKLLKPLEGDSEIQALFEQLTGDTSGQELTFVKPLYVQAAEQRAAEMGISSDQVLADYAHRLRESRFPTPECLRADALQAHIGGAHLSEEQVSHLNACEPCRKLVEASRPSEAAVSSLLQDVRSMAVVASGSKDRQQEALKTISPVVYASSSLEQEEQEEAEPDSQTKGFGGLGFLHHEQPTLNINEASMLQGAFFNAWLSLRPEQREDLLNYINRKSGRATVDLNSNSLVPRGKTALERLRSQVRSTLLARTLASDKVDRLCAYVDKGFVKDNLMLAAHFAHLTSGSSDIFKRR